MWHHTDDVTGMTDVSRPHFTTDLKHLSSDADAGVLRELPTNARPSHAQSDKRILSAESTVGLDRVFHSAPMSLPRGACLVPS